MDHPHHHPVLLLRLRRREQLGQRKLGRRLRVQQLWLRRLQQRLRLRLQQLRLQQLLLWQQLLLQRLLLLTGRPWRDALRPAFSAPQRDRRSLTSETTSRWMSSGVRGTSRLAQSTTAQPCARAISPAHSRQRRR